MAPDNLKHKIYRLLLVFEDNQPIQPASVTASSTFNYKPIIQPAVVLHSNFYIHSSELSTDLAVQNKVSVKSCDILKVGK